jgi:hypothetical protein
MEGNVIAQTTSAISTWPPELDPSRPLLAAIAHGFARSLGVLDGLWRRALSSPS